MSQKTTDTVGIGARLSDIGGVQNVETGESLGLYSARGETPIAAVSPTDDAQAAEMARAARLEGTTVVVWGGGTKQDVEPVQQRDGIVLLTGKLRRVELDAANLTVTVGAGKVVDDLQRELAGEGLFLPLDPVDSARSTIGGTLAANSSGPNRLLYRTARDITLGLKVASPLGDLLRIGGKTVKDVAGYDLKKLYIGSWGTLGAITEATFRLLPLPEAHATVVSSFPFLSDASSTVTAILASYLVPSSAELISPGALQGAAWAGARDGEYLLAVTFEGATEAVKRQVADLEDMAGRNRASLVSVLEGESEAGLWRQRKSLLGKEPGDSPWMTVKGSVSIKLLFDYLSGIACLESDLGLRASFVSHAGNGVVYALLTADAGKTNALVSAAQRIQRIAADCGGFAMVQRASRELAGAVQLWPPRNDYGLMRKIKAELDPDNLWSPERVPGGRN